MICKHIIISSKYLQSCTPSIAVPYEDPAWQIWPHHIHFHQQDVLHAEGKAMLPHTGWDIVNLFANLQELIMGQEHQSIGKQIGAVNKHMSYYLYNYGLNTVY